MTVHNFVTPGNIVLYVGMRNNAAKMQGIIRDGKGIEEERVRGCIERGEYIEALNAIWSERDRPKRLDFLRTHAKEHAPILFELAVAEAAAVIPKEGYDSATHDAEIRRVVSEVAMPLIKYAGLRVIEDAVAIDDASLQDAHAVMDDAYILALQNLIKKRTGKQNTSFVDNKRMTQRLIEILERDVDGEMPSPKWVALHGLRIKIDGSITLHDDRVDRQQAKRAELLGVLRAALARM